jgi:hypothetical protein
LNAKPFAPLIVHVIPLPGAQVAGHVPRPLSISTSIMPLVFGLFPLTRPALAQDRNSISKSGTMHWFAMAIGISSVTCNACTPCRRAAFDVLDILSLKMGVAVNSADDNVTVPISGARLGLASKHGIVIALHSQFSTRLSERIVHVTVAGQLAGHVSSPNMPLVPTAITAAQLSKASRMLSRLHVQRRIKFVRLLIVHKNFPRHVGIGLGLPSTKHLCD